MIPVIRTMLPVLSLAAAAVVIGTNQKSGPAAEPAVTVPAPSRERLPVPSGLGEVQTLADGKATHPGPVPVRP